MTDPVPYDAPVPPRTSTTDRVVTVLLMVGLTVLVPIASFFGLFFGMASDGCVGDTPCSTGQLTAGVSVGAVSPWLVLLAALVVVVVRWVRRRRTWWVPLAALAVGLVLWVGGGLLAASAVG